MMKKVIRPCTVKEGNRRASVFIEITYDNKRLSLHGVIGPLPSGNALGGCGQIQGHFSPPDEEDYDNPEYFEWVQKYHAEVMESITFAPYWNMEMFEHLLKIWERWHLNDLNAGCIHQRELMPQIKQERGKKFFYAENLYKIWELPEFFECPECGYKYGTAWLFEEVPHDVIEWLFNLPDADKTPAWV